MLDKNSNNINKAVTLLEIKNILVSIQDFNNEIRDISIISKFIQILFKTKIAICMISSTEKAKYCYFCAFLVI